MGEGRKLSTARRCWRASITAKDSCVVVDLPLCYASVKGTCLPVFILVKFEFEFEFEFTSSLRGG